MDSGDYFYIVVFIIWLLSQISAAAKKARQKSARRPQKAPPPTPRVPPRRPARPQDHARGQARGMLQQIEHLGAEIEASLPELDDRVQAQVSFVVEREIRNDAERLRATLTDDTSPEMSVAAREAQALVRFQRELLHAARTHTTLRRRRELRGARLVADRLVEEFDQSRERTIAPPVAVVWDLSSDDEMAASPLAGSTLFVPRSVLHDPSHWSLIADPIARYISEEAPTLYQELHERLELGVDEAQVGADPEALTRLLFASWIHRIVADAVGALFFGPIYLRAVSRLYAQPETPARVTSIYLNTDGSVHAEPPAHLRVHLNAQWVTRMGYPKEAAEVRREWDERHGSPQAIGFWGAMTSLPASPVLGAACELMDAMYQLPLQALGGSQLPLSPGLSDWQTRAREASDATELLKRGDRARGSARGIVAGAIAAALDVPEAAVKIHAALYDSLSRELATRRPPKRAPTRRAAPTADATALSSPTRRQVAEALILGEILLEPRSR